MTNKLEFYRCKTCGNLVQVLISGEGELVCCGTAMELLEPNTNENDMGEYHVPVFMYDDEKENFVQVGKQFHPMTEEHHIEFVQVISRDKKCAKLRYLEPNEEPIMYLKNSMDIPEACAIEMCNIHGLWGGCNDK